MDEWLYVLTLDDAGYGYAEHEIWLRRDLRQICRLVAAIDRGPNVPVALSPENLTDMPRHGLTFQLNNRTGQVHIVMRRVL